jgi:hypothetical protein
MAVTYTSSTMLIVHLLFLKKYIKLSESNGSICRIKKTRPNGQLSTGAKKLAKNAALKRD